MSNDRYGATPEEWAHLDLVLGLGDDLLPVVANPNAIISPNSSIKKLGKVPSKYNGKGLVSGFPVWAEHRATAAELNAWQNHADYGACIITRQVRGLDADIHCPVLALEVETFIADYLGFKLPKRYRANSSKFLHPFVMASTDPKYSKWVMYLNTDEEVEAGTKNEIEFLMAGHQFVAAGTHDSGARIEWEGGLPGVIPELSTDAFEGLFDALQARFGKRPPAFGQASTPRVKSTPGARVAGASVDTELDPALVFMRERGLVLGESHGKLIVACPNEKQHGGDTTGTDTTVYFPYGHNGFSQAGFECRHNHCTGIKLPDFYAHIGYVQPAMLPAGLVCTGLDDEPQPALVLDAPKKAFSLNQFSLTGRSAEMREKMLDDKYVLGRMAILGQSTVFYAKPGAGKTLLTLWLLIEAIQAGSVVAADVHYFNADDDYKGLVTKLELAEKYGFNMAVPGYRVGAGFPVFEAKDLPLYLDKLIKQGDARGVVVILDTLKKFTDPMDKKVSSAFGKSMREFVSSGGTVIMLAHTNKNRTADGKVVFSGTSDISDDADCAYTLDKIEDASGAHTAVFENFKMRGDVAKLATCQYDGREGVSYLDRLGSVRALTGADTEAARRAREVREKLEKNASVIRAILDALANGTTAKTKLVETASKESGWTKAKVIGVLDAHTGDVYATGARWQKQRADKNELRYEALAVPDSDF